MMNLITNGLDRARVGCICAVVAACLLLVGCGSSSPSATSATTSTGAPAATTGTTATTGPEAEISGKLDSLPQAPKATGTLAAQPTSTSTPSEHAYLHEVFNDAQRFWEREFSEARIQYVPARLRLFAGTVHTGCGAQADSGPFYCPADHTVYLDLGFFELLARHAGVGPFGQAYIVGHELGHHVQFLIGVTHRVAALNQQQPSGENARSVRVELQADCLSGVWAYSSQARGQLTEADLNDALKTAALVGDDFQMRAAGHVVDSALWTHGSSAQRQHWLTTGFESGRPDACDTFGTTSP